MLRHVSAFAVLLAAGLSTVQAAPNLGNNIRSAVSTFLIGNSEFRGGVAFGTQAFLAGEITNGFRNNREGFSGLFVLSTRDTPLASLGVASQSLFEMGYDILLPLYEALDEPAMRLAAFGAAGSEPLGEAIVSFSRTFAVGIRDSTLLSSSIARSNTLPGLE